MKTVYTIVITQFQLVSIITQTAAFSKRHSRNRKSAISQSVGAYSIMQRSRMFIHGSVRGAAVCAQLCLFVYLLVLKLRNHGGRERTFGDHRTHLHQFAPRLLYASG